MLEISWISEVAMDVRTLADEARKLLQENATLRSKLEAAEARAEAAEKRVSEMAAEWNSLSTPGLSVRQLVELQSTQIEGAERALDVFGIARGDGGHSLRYRIGLLGERAQEAESRAEKAEAERDAFKAENERLRTSWRCFHCGVLIGQESQARAHFGTIDDAGPCDCQRERDALKAEVERLRERDLHLTAVERCVEAECDALRAKQEATKCTEPKAAARMIASIREREKSLGRELKRLRVAVAGPAFMSEDPEAWVEIAKRMRGRDPKISPQAFEVAHTLGRELISAGMLPAVALDAARALALVVETMGNRRAARRLAEVAEDLRQLVDKEG